MKTITSFQEFNQITELTDFFIFTFAEGWKSLMGIKVNIEPDDEDQENLFCELPQCQGNLPSTLYLYSEEGLIKDLILNANIWDPLEGNDEDVLDNHPDTLQAMLQAMELLKSHSTQLNAIAFQLQDKIADFSDSGLDLNLPEEDFEFLKDDIYGEAYNQLNKYL